MDLMHKNSEHVLKKKQTKDDFEKNSLITFYKMYKLIYVPSSSKNMAYPIIHCMYTAVKMLNKIDNPSKQTAVVICVRSVQNVG